ncbi:hypothetical protein HDU79_009916 [Rhizoclosmatium sp. JEL0117]|nr:hypothetical protein HDU79_009916 [Rhizoclosmatium sp. JEL0117]
MLFVSRINDIARGNTGIRVETMNKILRIYNTGLLPWILSEAPDDITPLGQLTLALIGRGRMWNPRSHAHEPTASVLAEFGLQPVHLTAREVQVMLLGTKLATVKGAEAATRALYLAYQADIVAAMSIEVNGCSSQEVLDLIAENVNYSGQKETMCRAFQLLTCNVGLPLRASALSFSNTSDVFRSKVNSAQWLSFPSLVQRHGPATHDISEAARNISIALNSAMESTRPRLTPHGYVHTSLQGLVGALGRLASSSETRIESYPAAVLGNLQMHLPAIFGAFLDPIQAVIHLERVLAVELLAACKALESSRPLETTPPLEAVYNLVREHIPKENIDGIVDLLRTGRVLDVVSQYMHDQTATNCFFSDGWVWFI